jgi:hypothetical protein
MENHEVTAAEYPLTLRINGEDKEFLAVLFSDRDYDAIDLWVQSQVISITRNSLRLELEEAEESGDKDQIALVQATYEEEMQTATRAAIAVSIYEASGTKILNTPKGVARLFWMMCRKHDPKLKYIECIAWCRVLENQNEIMRAFAKLNPREARTEETKVEVKEKDAKTGTVKNDEPATSS